jgi:hypothetical protein
MRWQAACDGNGTDCNADTFQDIHEQFTVLRYEITDGFEYFAERIEHWLQCFTKLFENAL